MTMFLKMASCLALSLMLILFTELCTAEEPPQAVLEAIITIEPFDGMKNPDRIMPLGQAKIKTVIRNKGAKASRATRLAVRFVLPKPLQTSPNSRLFETETVDLPSIQPGQERTVVFEKSHQYPSVADFIRYDWPMRQYEAILKNNEEELVIGMVSMTISGYYYAGPPKEIPKIVPAKL